MTTGLFVAAWWRGVTDRSGFVRPSHRGCGGRCRSSQVTGWNRAEAEVAEPPHPPPREGVDGVVTGRAVPEQVSLVNVLVYNHSQHSLWRSPIRQMSTRHQTRA